MHLPYIGKDKNSQWHKLDYQLLFGKWACGPKGAAKNQAYHDHVDHVEILHSFNLDSKTDSLKIWQCIKYILFFTEYHTFKVAFMVQFAN